MKCPKCGWDLSNKMFNERYCTNIECNYRLKLDNMTRQERNELISKIESKLRLQGERSIGTSWLERMSDDELIKEACK